MGQSREQGEARKEGGDANMRSVVSESESEHANLSKKTKKKRR